MQFKRICYTFSVLAGMAVSGISAFGDSLWDSIGKYAELKAGHCFLSQKKDLRFRNRPCVGAEFGVSYQQWRLGLELGYTHFENKSQPTGGDFEATMFDSNFTGSVSYFNAWTFMANLYHDWTIGEKTSFYLGGGIGMMRLKYRFLASAEEYAAFDRDYSQSKNAFAAQISFGLGYALTENWTLAMGYHCMKVQNVKFSHPLEQEGPVAPKFKTPLIHSIEIGLRYCF